MYDFLNAFVDLVRPRAREFPALVMPEQHEHEDGEAASSAAGMGPPCSSCFPRSRSTGTCIHDAQVLPSIVSPRPEGIALISAFQILLMRE